MPQFRVVFPGAGQLQCRQGWKAITIQNYNKATPIKCQDLHVKFSQMKLEAGCILISCFSHCFRDSTVLLWIWEKRAQSIPNLRGRGSHLIGLIWEEVHGVLLYYVQNYAGCLLEFLHMAQALPGGLVVSYFIGVAYNGFTFLVKNKELPWWKIYIAIRCFVLIFRDTFWAKIIPAQHC